MNSYLDEVPNLTSVKVRLSVQSITFFREVTPWFSVGSMMQVCFLTNVWSTLAAGTKPAPAHFLFTFHSSADRAHQERINEGKTDHLESNRNEEREFLCAAK